MLTSLVHLLRFDDVVEDVLREYEARQAAEDRLDLTSQTLDLRRDDLLLSVGRATGLLVNLIARESRAQSILELGTAYGYSTIWLADAARATGGRVLSVDVVEEKQRYASAALRRAGLAKYVQFACCDAIELLSSRRQSFDFVLLDVWKDAYIPCVDRLLQHLHPGALLVADNMLRPASSRMAASRYVARLDQLPHARTVILPVGHGVAISRFASGTRPDLRGVEMPDAC